MASAIASPTTRADVPPEGRRGDWGRSSWSSGERPRWWPQGETWPPSGSPERWRQMRGRFVRRAMGFAFFAFLIFAFVVAAFVTLLTIVFNSLSAGGGSAVFVPLAVLAVVVVAFGFARGLRRFAIPLGDLIDAAESVEAGGYAQRGRPPGP